LAYRCGSLDCHGTSARNMRIYGFGALRSGSSAAGFDPLTSETSDEEVSLTYRSLVALEPDVMKTVVAEKTGVERLTLVRKGQGSDNHKGGNRMTSDGPMNSCLTSWLQGKTDTAACANAAKP
jgi:hypothetical protein